MYVLFRLKCVPRRRCAVTRNGPRKERGDCDSGASLLGRAAAGAAGGEPAKLWPQPPVPPERPGTGAARRGVGADAGVAGVAGVRRAGLAEGGEGPMRGTPADLALLKSRQMYAAGRPPIAGGLPGQALMH